MGLAAILPFLKGLPQQAMATSVPDDGSQDQNQTDSDHRWFKALTEPVA